MPFVADSLPVAIVMSYRDYNGNPSTTTHYLPAGTSHADAITKAGDLLNELTALTTAAIPSATITYELENDAEIVPAAASNVKDKLKLVFGSTNKRADYSVSIPSPFTGAEQQNTDQANTANAALNAFIDEMLNGAVGLANGFRTAANFDLDRVKAAFYTVRQREPNR